MAAAFPAAAQDLPALVDGLGAGGYSETEKQIEALAATGDPAVAKVLEALGAGELYLRKGDKKVFIAKGSGTLALSDPLTGGPQARLRPASSSASRSTIACAAQSARRWAR
jgi:urea transport system permease protein